MVSTKSTSTTNPGLAPLDPGGPTDSRAARARSEPMAVVALGDGRYDVVVRGGAAYTVDLVTGTCTCPDHAYRGRRCKHLRRVAIDVTERYVPAPDERDTVCAACGDPLFADAETPEPVYCDDCTLDAGDIVRDRERGDVLVVVETSPDRARHVAIGDHTVATHPTNDGYDSDDAVVETVYPHRAATPERLRERGVRTYAFPRGRLEPLSR
ncbi:hypotheical protein [Halarchaeum acidiphilum MH1-52-1]|uniref:Hypotheical protein n=1 Tax=Halarchaeum acidiphilum MH1-52-1 TaxID=1261545 RepID=U3ABL8_9EURY|nr:SWIM zinc finger family protein [Halarchaeum acidiphilum]GAD52173.1 hypotheical protein [Halarchaeum acidiphilum MH1-52-1]